MYVYTYVCVEPMIIPGFQRTARRALHCYYNETRINTSRWSYVIGAITFLWWFSWPRRRGARGEKKEKEKKGEKGRERERNEAGRASSLGPEKLSEIMSEEIGSLARGWLTARSARTTFFLSFSIPLATRYRSIYLGISTVTPTPVSSAAFFLPISSPSFRPSAKDRTARPLLPLPLLIVF